MSARQVQWVEEAVHEQWHEYCKDNTGTPAQQKTAEEALIELYQTCYYNPHGGSLFGGSFCRLAPHIGDYYPQTVVFGIYRSIERYLRDVLVVVIRYDSGIH